MNDWFFDGKGEPDPETAALAEQLRKPYQGSPPELPQRHSWRRWALPLAATAMLAAGLAFALRGPPLPTWEITLLDGPSPCGRADCALAVGDWLETGAVTTVRLAVADIGSMVVAPGSRLRLAETGPAQHRLELRQGRVDAQVVAPPRLLVVDTPSARAVDLGCAYTLEVDAAGDGTLAVTSGYVALEGEHRTVTVPRGATARLRGKGGPATPIWMDAGPEFGVALVALDNGGPLAPVLEHARPVDTLSLYHLLDRPDKAEVLDRIQALVPAAAELDRAPLLSGDAASRAVLWDVLYGAWE